MSVKVSVIVAAYQPGDGIDRVIGSLDRQTMPADEFELIVIDDGSPDDTFKRLQAFQQTHPNLIIDRIENSGWPSRPRNIALERARGEYVLFMDHDDFIYPQGLERAYAYAAANRADVLSPKESKTTDVAWGIDNYNENVPNARESRGISALMPMMPHKFYRRQFLLEHGIRFPEGRRMLWEDIYFNVEAYRHASVISILSDTPVYKWVHTGSNNSGTYGPADSEFWDKLDRLFAFIVEALPGDEFRAARETMIIQLYRTRVLGRFYSWLGDNDPREVTTALRRARAIVDKHVPEVLESRMGKKTHGESVLLRSGDTEAMRTLKAIDRAVIGLTRTERVIWLDRSLVIESVTTWDGVEGTRMPLEKKDGRILRALPSRLAESIPPAALDVTSDLERARTIITARARHDHTTWAVPTTDEVLVDDTDPLAVTVTVRSRAAVDLDSAAMGNPLRDPVWDFHARNKLIGITNHRSLRTETAAQVAFIDGTVAIAYRNKSAHLSLDLAQQVRTAVGDGGPDLVNATATRSAPHEYTISIPLTRVHIVGRTELTGELELRPKLQHSTRRYVDAIARRLRLSAPQPKSRPTGPCLLVADENGALLTGSIRGRAGNYLLATRFGEHTTVSTVGVRIGRTGRVRLTVG